MACCCCFSSRKEVKLETPAAKSAPTVEKKQPAARNVFNAPEKQTSTLAVPPKEVTTPVVPRKVESAPVDEQKVESPPVEAQKEESSPVDAQQASTPVETQEEATPVETQEESTAVEALEEATSVEAQEESSAVEALEEATSAETTEESTAVEAQEETTAAETQEESTPVEANEEETAVEAQQEESTPVEAPQSPEWLNASLMEEALQLSGEKDLKVDSVSAKLATAPGDNYASALYRATATLADGGERSFLVKTPAPGEILGKNLEAMGIFPREGAMLAQVIPKMEAMLEEVAPGRYPPLAPRCPIHGTTPVHYLVLEDLAPQDFKMADRHLGLGLRHSLHAIRSLARYHAASVAYLAREPDLGPAFATPSAKDFEAFAGFFTAALNNTAKACRTWPGYEEIADSLDAFKGVVLDKFVELHTPKPDAFNVLLHGDFWVNNMMFRYQEGKPKDLRMVDFQGSHVASPALDLLYILSTSLSEDVSEYHTDLLIREYHRTLEEVLTLFDMPVPAFEQLLIDLDIHGCTAVLSAILLLPILKTTKPPDFDDMVQGVDSVSYLYDNPVVRSWLQRLLPEYKQKGWLSF